MPTVIPANTCTVRWKALPAITGVSNATTRRMIAAGDFPAPFKISNQAVGFDRTEVEAWIEDRKARRQEVAQ